MSDTTSTAFDYVVGPDADEAKEFTTNQWRETLGTLAWDRYVVQRKAALRFLAIPPLFLSGRALLPHLHVAQEYIPWLMVFVIIPLIFFRGLMKDVAYRSTAAGMVDLFQLGKFDEGYRLTSLTTGEFKELLSEHFSNKSKKKQRKAAVDALLKTDTGAKKPLMWLSVLCLAIVLIVGSGPFLGLLFALTYACTILTTIRYFRVATPPLKKLGAITKETGTSEDAPAPKAKKTAAPEADKSHKDDEVTVPANVSTSDHDKALLDLLIKHHNHEPLSEFDKALLYSTFATKSGIPFKDVEFPTPAEFEKTLEELASVQDATPEDTSSMPAPAPAPAMPPLPRRIPAKHARTDAAQSGPTGTPAHGTPVLPNNAVLSAPVPPQSPAPAPAAAPRTFTTEELDILFDRCVTFGRDTLSPEEYAAIEPHLKRR